MDLYIAHLVALVLALILTYLITPLIEKMAIKIGAVDYPTERKIHIKPVPRLGGVSIFLSFIIVVGLYLGYRIGANSYSASDLMSNNKDIIGILIGGTFVFLFGCIDDILQITARFKFIGQLVGAIIVVYFGVIIEFIGSPAGGLINIPKGLGIVLTIFWIVGLTNTFNFIDGLDGLAAGVGTIALVALYFSAMETGKVNIALMMTVLAGTLIGFLRHNFNPARIFMGDSGSMFIGFILGAITVQSAAKSTATLALLVPLVIMGVPIFDTGYAIWRRFINKRPLTVADKEHIHHRLLKKGFSHKKVVLLIYAWTAALSGIGISLRFSNGTVKIILLLTLIIVTFLLARYTGLFDWFLKMELRKEKQ